MRNPRHRGFRHSWPGRALPALVAPCLVIVLSSTSLPPVLLAREYALTVLPPEHRSMTDPTTGVELVFVTTDPADDEVLYYEQRSFLADESVLLFTSSRQHGGLMGYLMATGEIVRLETPAGRLGGATAARRGRSFYATRGREIVEMDLRILQGTPTKILARERLVAVLPSAYTGFSTALSESADGALLGVGASRPDDNGRGPRACVLTVHTRTGRIRELTSMPASDFHGHVMFSRDVPYLLYYLGADSYRTVLDARTGCVLFQHRKSADEYATHHCWWRGHVMTFCGGYHLPPTEDGDVKTLDIRTGQVHILGKGSWWPDAQPRELARLNWWHAAGDEQGRWVAADNWHGDIGLFHAVTTRTYILTRGHRTYGGGAHPHVGWDRKGGRVVFTSNLLGNPDVCLATIPLPWQREWRAQISGKRR